MRSRALLRVLGVAVAAALVGLLPATLAHAEPSVTEIEKQIDEAWNKLEPVIEQYNNIHNQLKANQIKAAALEKTLRPLQLQVDLALDRVGALASEYYKGGGSTSAVRAILVTGSPTKLAEQLGLLDQFARSQQEQIATVAAARDKYGAEKKQLDGLIALQAAQDADLAGKKKSIEAEVDRLQRLRTQAYGSSTSGGALRMGACPAVYTPGPGGNAARAACAQIGKWYVWNTAGPNNFDCSGLTLFAWARNGVSLSHYTGAQWREGRAVSKAQLVPGDLVFYHSDLHHVALYVGNNLVVHAPRTGDQVRMAPMDMMPIAGYRRPG